MWLVSDLSCDVEGGHMMGHMATEMTKILGAVEVCSNDFVVVV